MTRSKKNKSWKVPFHQDCIACRKCISCPKLWLQHTSSPRHTRDLEKYKKKLEKYVRVQECDGSNFDIDCAIQCNDGINKALTVDDFSKYGKKFERRPRKCSLEEEDDKKQLNAQNDDESNEGCVEIMTEDEKIIESLRVQGFSIPSSVSKVWRVKRRKGFRRISELIELTENCVLLHEEELIGLLIFDFFSLEDSLILAPSLYKLCETAGFVKRSKKLKMNYQFMFGARKGYGKFDRYKQTMKPPGLGCLPGKEPPTSTDIDFFAVDVVNFIYKRFKMHLHSWTEQWESMVPFMGTSYARLGNSPFTTMGTTLNFYVSPHCDETDSGFSPIAWFERFFNPSTCRQAVFRLVDFGLFIKPKQGTLLIFKTSTIKHQTIQNDGYPQLGLALAVKTSILDAGREHMDKVGLAL